MKNKTKIKKLKKVKKRKRNKKLKKPMARTLELDPYFTADSDESSRSVVIGNISPKVTLDEVYSIFENFGIITDVKPIKSRRFD